MYNKNLNKNHLLGTYWVGIVEDNNDPDLKGRCKIRILGLLDESEEGSFKIPTGSLPWCNPSGTYIGGGSSGGGFFSVPKLGSYVRITFDNGNIYNPLYHENLNLSDELKEEIKDSYQNSHILLYDTSFGLREEETGEYVNDRKGEWIKVFFTEESGFNIQYNNGEVNSKINIESNGNILINNSNGVNIKITKDGVISLFNNESNIEIALKGETLKKSLETIIDFLKTHTHPTAFGPSGPPINITPLTKATKLLNDSLSETVKFD